MAYWIDLFTGTTWGEFQDAGAKVSGFSPRKHATVDKIQKGDVLICYMTGVMRWVGALEVLGRSKNKSKIWKDTDFPERLNVKPLVMLSAENGVPMSDLLGKVDFYQNAAMSPGFKGFLRGSPALFKKQQDGDFILAALRKAQASPVSRPVDPKKLARRPRFKVKWQEGDKQVEATVSVPEPEDPAKTFTEGSAAENQTRHTEIQYGLLELGAEMNLDVWVARNDKSRLWNGGKLGELPRVLRELPTQFNDATQRTIELIDVLWLKGNSIVAAFEVEASTTIYSGLLRMSDLLSLQPNLDIRLYLVASQDRRDRVQQEIERPTFRRLPKPLPPVCGFLSFEKLTEYVTGIRKLDLASSLQPTFLDKVAEYFDKDEDE